MVEETVTFRIDAERRAAVDRLAVFPESGRKGRVHGTRELAVPETPFIVTYRVTRETVDILAVVHTRRRWPTTLD